MGLGLSIQAAGTKVPELEAAREIHVYQQLGAMTQFRIRLQLVESSGDFALLSDDRWVEGSDISIVAPFKGANHYLVQGPVTSQVISLKYGIANSQVELAGFDKSIEMTREQKVALWPGSDADAFSQIVDRYGFKAVAGEVSAQHQENQHPLVQRDSDYQFVKRLAGRNGFYFWISTDAEGKDSANFRRPELAAEPAAKLSLTKGANNIDHIEIGFDVERPVSAEASEVKASDNSDITVSIASSTLAPLGAKPFSSIGKTPRTAHFRAPVDDSDDLQARVDGLLVDQGWFVRARCLTTPGRIGTVLSPGSIVSLTGAGKRHSGSYLVWSVGHVVTPATHNMHLELYRNAWN